MSFLSPPSPGAMLDHCTDRGENTENELKTCLKDSRNSLAGHEGSCGHEEGARQRSRAAQIPCGITTAHTDTAQAER